MLAESAVQHRQTCTHVHTSCLCWGSLASRSLGLSAFLQSKQVYSSSLLSGKSMFTCKHAATLQGKDKDMPAAASPGARWELPTGCSTPSSLLRLPGGACSTARQCTYSGQLLHGSLTALCTAASLGAAPHALSHLAPDGSSRNYWESKQWSKKLKKKESEKITVKILVRRVRSFFFEGVGCVCCFIFSSLGQCKNHW